MPDDTKDLIFRTPAAAYATFLHGIRNVAHRHGYAVAVHGSMVRDLDLVAIPWVEGAAEPRQLAEAIREFVGGYWSWPRGDREIALAGRPGEKPHGRLIWVINLADGLYIDLSVMTPDLNRQRDAAVLACCETYDQERRDETPTAEGVAKWLNIPESDISAILASGPVADGGAK